MADPIRIAHGIRRCEFDAFLLARCGADLRLGESVTTLVREADGWRVNGSLAANLGRYRQPSRWWRPQSGGIGPTCRGSFPLGHPKAKCHRHARIWAGPLPPLAKQY